MTLDSGSTYRHRLRNKWDERRKEEGMMVATVRMKEDERKRKKERKREEEEKRETIFLRGDSLRPLE